MSIETLQALNRLLCDTDEHIVEKVSHALLAKGKDARLFLETEKYRTASPLHYEHIIKVLRAFEMEELCAEIRKLQTEPQKVRMMHLLTLLSVLLDEQTPTLTNSWEEHKKQILSTAWVYMKPENNLPKLLSLLHLLLLIHIPVHEESISTVGLLFHPTFLKVTNVTNSMVLLLQLSIENLRSLWMRNTQYLITIQGIAMNSKEELQLYTPFYQDNYPIGIPPAYTTMQKEYFFVCSILENQNVDYRVYLCAMQDLLKGLGYYLEMQHIKAILRLLTHQRLCVFAFIALLL